MGVGASGLHSAEDLRKEMEESDDMKNEAKGNGNAYKRLMFKKIIVSFGDNG